MRKTLFYSSFVAAALAEAIVFITTTTYLQLGVAALLYIPLVYFALKLFPRKTQTMNITIESSTEPAPPAVINKPEHEDISLGRDSNEDVNIIDIDKRAFLKMIGATGIAFFLSSLFTRKASALLLGKEEGKGITTIQDTAGKEIDPAKHQPTDDYKISEVDYGITTFYGFMNGTDGWYIMKEDISTGTFRYIKGDTNFPDNWANRQSLNYDYFNHVFPQS